MSRNRRQSKALNFDGEFDITPMIDVVFLLLIFFIVTARMAPKNVGTLPKAKHGETSAASESVVINVVASGNDVIVKRKDGSVLSANKDEQAVEIADYIHHGFENKGMRNIMICAEPRVKSREIARLREVIVRETEPGTQILIAVSQ